MPRPDEGRTGERVLLRARGSHVHRLECAGAAWHSDTVTTAVEIGTQQRRAPAWVAWTALGLASVALAVSAIGYFARSPGATATAQPAPASVSVTMLTGATVDQAKTVLAREGLKLGHVTSLPIRGMPRELIAFQTPASGASVGSGTAVDVWVSAGWDPSSNPKCVELGSQNTCSNSWSG